MRRKVALVVALGAAAGMLLSACSSTPAAPKSITVWLQTDAQQGWPALVAAANATFQKANPNTKVNVEYQTWGDHLTKLDASLAGKNPPDVVELGNTETTKYMANGALADLGTYKFPNSSTWLQGLADAGKYDGKTYAVPYYAGARAVIYRTDWYAAQGIAIPTSQDEFNAANTKLMAAYGATNPKFSAFYAPGKYWYLAMSYVYDQGGQIATSSGSKWTATLTSPQSQAGLAAWQKALNIGSRADKSGTEANQWNALSSGLAASDYGNGWEVGLVFDPKAGNPKLKGKIAAYPMPSAANPGSQMPTFLGGSVLAVPAKSAAASLGAEWIADFTSTANQTALAKMGVLPNTTSLLSFVPAASQPFAQAAQKSWFVPTAPNWANVETAQIIPTMLSSILTGQATIAQATATADDQINTILNQ